jgi:hypothetical protein
MAWLWWLLTPIASTLLGGLLLRLRARAEAGHRPSRDAIAEHRAFLAALAQPGHRSDPEPVTMLVLDGDHSASAPS